MRYKELGKTGIEVSEICLGTWGIGGAGWGDNNQTDCIKSILGMYDCGVNFYDTAPAYNAGVAESILGKALEGKRDKVVLMTKTGTDFVDGNYTRDNSAGAVVRQCEASLRNLKTDYIDIYLVHWPDENVPMEETFSALNQLKADGKIRKIGVSNFSLAQIKEAEQYSEISVIQDEYSMVKRSEEKKIKAAFEQSIGVTTYGSLGAGILTGRYRELPRFENSDVRAEFYNYFKEPRFSEIMKLLAVMDEIAGNHDDVTLSQIALNWNIQKDYISSAIVGVSSPRHVESNCKTCDWKLSPQEIKKLDDCLDKISGLK